MELKLLVSTLRSGLEAALLVAMLSAYLKATGRREVLRPLKWATFFAIVASLALAYGVQSVLDREAMEGFLNFMAAIGTLGLILWIACTAYAGRGASKPLILGCLVFTVTATTVTIRGLDISVSFTRALVQASGAFTPDGYKVTAGIVGIVAAAVVGALLHRVLTQFRPLALTVVLGLSLLVLLVWTATAAVQVMLIRGLIPLTDWLFNIIVLLVNSYSTFHYLLFTLAAVALLFAVWEQWRHKPRLEGLNPAQKRKTRSAARQLRGALAVAVLSFVLVLTVDRVSTVYANRPFKLSPATPVSTEGDSIMIPVASVNDGKLHRFSFESGGSGVRFLVVHKGSGVFGIGLDACEFCGAAGYHQKGKDVICSKCGAAINVATIGLPGGCNPIPLHYHLDGEQLVIPVAALDASAGLFH